MLRPIVRGAAANAGLIFHVFAQDSASTTGAGKASVAYSSFSCYYIRNGEAISGAITPQDITTIGTYAAPTANTNIRIKAVDNTNMIGVYELQLHLDWVNTTNTCQSLTIYLSASGVAVLPLQIPLTAWDPQLLQATPTNITAGTITTVTNLTNAPTSGDLTATMKTSVTTAASAATPVATLSSAYDAAKTAASQTSVNTIDDYVDTEIAALQTDVTAIKAKTDALSTTAEIATAVHSEAVPGVYAAGTAGARIGGLTYTVAGVLDSNIQRVNDVVVTGTGAPGTEWGP